MKRFKKISLIIFLCGLIAALSVTFVACGGNGGGSASGSKITFVLSDDGTYYTAREADRNISGELVIPPTYNNLPVQCGNFQMCSITKATLSEGITQIPTRAFYYCEQLTEVVIPASVTWIRNAAFSNCFAFSKITYAGTQEQWNAIKKDRYWEPNSGIHYTIYCADGTISK